MTSTADMSGKTVRQVVEEQSSRVLETYRIDKGLIQEHANGERRINQGGYGERQIYELVQNGADEMRTLGEGEIRVILTEHYLYCANTGNPMTPDGADTILRMSVSRKRGGQIGRFGVGVKSVLSVSDAPEFYSSTGSFGFDRDWAASRIRSVAPDVVETPVLRLARPIETQQARTEDRILDELLARAVTVVRLPLTPGSAERLGADLRSFPSEFQLFSPHVAHLHLEDRRPGRTLHRVMSVKASDTLHTLQGPGEDGRQTTSVWNVFRCSHRPSVTALRSAGELHDRPEIDLAWAVPQGSGGGRGTFWAYFPTNYATTLRGLLNAPWKTGEDRQNLFDHNAFNDELIERAAELVVESLPYLVQPADPGSYLMLLPGRGREAPQWADERLTNAVWKAAASRPSIPDQNGELRRPDQLNLTPDGMIDDWLAMWSGYDGRPMDWTHKSIENRERRAKANLIFDKAGRPEASVREWLEALVADGRPEGSARAILIVAAMVRCGHSQAADALRARIILTESCGMVPAKAGGVFRRSDQDGLDDDLVYVDPRVTELDAVSAALNELGVREANAAGRLAAVLDKGFARYFEQEWNDFWKLCRRVPAQEAADAIRTRIPGWRREIRVRTLDGRHRRPVECLLPGRVVPTDGSRDRGVTVDLGTHAADRALLTALGMSDVPVADLDPRQDEWFDQYQAAALEAMCAALPAGVPYPKASNTVVEGANPAGPLGLLPALSEEGRCLFLKHLPPGGLVRDWTARANRQTQHAQVDSPLVWMAKKHGRVQTNEGTVAVRSAVGPSLVEYRDILPVAQIDRAVADLLDLPATITDIPGVLWEQLVTRVATTEEDAVPGRAYALVLRAGAEWPGGDTRCRIGAKWGTRPDDQICVTANPHEYQTLVRENVPALLAPTTADVDAMIQTWGMRRYAEMVSRELRKVEETEPVAVVAEFAHIRLLRGRKADGWTFVQCSELDEVTRTPLGMRTHQLDIASRDNVVYVRQTTDKAALLGVISRELGLHLSSMEINTVLQRADEARNNDVLKAVRAARDNISKLLLLIGRDQLQSGLPEGVLAWERTNSGQEPDDRRVTELALHAHGDGILRHHRKDLEKRHEALNVRFTGDTKSRRAVADLGLPDNYAGVGEDPVSATEQVPGPTPHFPLHDYQETLAARMHRMLMQQPPSRAMLSLPTGAGKTRVAAEAVIRYIKEHGQRGLPGPVLWIAQSDELCEQAVQSWRYVWEKAGAARTRLTISRFWSTREATPVTENPHLVVATIDKLTANLDDPAYAWLHTPALVIVDEAHGSTSPSYTRVFERFGLTQQPMRTARPLIGLTATPFRGRSEDETRRLVNRYGATRLDDNLFEGEPYPALQRMRVLAHVDHRVLEGGTLRLTDEEMSHMSQLHGGTLPPGAEQRLADDHVRNGVLLEALCELDPDWPVLVFATSVNHARFLSVMLNDRGVTSAAVDAQTPTARRRQIIEQFATRRIRVLTNYGVLHQGFDAPATRAVVVARPTYSPNVYQQMIGRGLRGQANGGKERCLILNVRDNIVNYGQQLAFTAFEKMWGGE
ncbi:hypothetical protein CS0771_32380 [Catellatospora sp. IY07-71]|uniref:DEAD/DEAH box helicase n=1 Tax=Catellatospora sp. IY07-71 TaxID=2728827 RepID=UPI001BB43A90|nr:DEAD/DEAH box helicase family protein [Catellatospora sp. IY07-71]BCJ73694.1 hypothetical protein CS0771_32380 [Catellatospora sp. IY07-71]